MTKVLSSAEPEVIAVSRVGDSSAKTCSCRLLRDARRPTNRHRCTTILQTQGHHFSKSLSWADRSYAVSSASCTASSASARFHNNRYARRNSLSRAEDDHGASGSGCTPDFAWLAPDFTLSSVPSTPAFRRYAWPNRRPAPDRCAMPPERFHLIQKKWQFPVALECT